MPQPFVIAHHLLWTAYGWWLPNDPRGSGSKIIRNPSLTKLGDLHYGRKSDQPSGHEIRTFYSRAQPLLRHNLLTLHGDEVPTAACGLAQCIQQHNFTCYACAIMPDHVHLVLRKHKHAAEEMIDNLQALSHERLIPAGYRAVEHPGLDAGRVATLPRSPKVCPQRHYLRRTKPTGNWITQATMAVCHQV